MSVERKILNVYAVIIGLFFIVSGIGKALDTARFTILISQYGFDSLMLLSPVIVLFEILIGVLLILLINPKRYAMLSSILLIVFTIAFTYAHFTKGINDCGCFGTIQPSKTPFSLSILRNIILIGMSVYLWVKYPKEKTEITRWKKIILLIVMSISIFITGLTFKLPSSISPKTETHKYNNKHIKDTELSKYIKTSSDSTYLVFCFSYNCPHCLNSIENMRHFRKSKTIDNIISIVANDNKEEEVIFNKNFQPDFPIINIPLIEMQELTDSYPTTFFIKNDTIKVVKIGDLSSPFVFIKSYKTIFGNNLNN